MVPRYTRPQMAAIWSPEERYRIWFEIEALAAEAMAELGTIPAEAARAIREKGAPRAAAIGAAEVEAIDAIERVTRHDVIAFLTFMAEGIGPEARFMHQGMTSSDVLDTCLAVQLTRAADLLIADVDALLAALQGARLGTQVDPTIGRSHGIHAEPTTFGLKLAGYYAEFTRNRARLVAARAEIATCAISGPVGTFASVDPRVEEYRRGEAWPGGRAGLDPGHPARPPRRLLRRACGGGRWRSSGWRPRSATCNAPRCGRRRSSSMPGRRAAAPCRTSGTRC